jgi:hypothetical protein
MTTVSTYYSLQVQRGSVGAHGERVRAGGGRFGQGRSVHQRRQGPASQVYRRFRHRAPDHYVGHFLEFFSFSNIFKKIKETEKERKYTGTAWNRF